MQDNVVHVLEKSMSESTNKPLFTLHVVNHEDGLQHFAVKDVGPGWLLSALFINRLPAILRNSAWIGAVAIAAIQLWGR